MSGSMKRTIDIPFLVLDLGLDIINSVRRLDLEGDGFARKAAFIGQSMVMKLEE